MDGDDETIRALEAEILAAPDAIEPYVVLADALLQRGDRSAELVYLAQRSSYNTPLQAREKRLRRAAIGELAAYTGSKALALSWHMGFIRAALVRGWERPSVEIVRQLRQTPIARFLKQLHLDQWAGDAFAAFLADPFPGIRELFVEASIDVVQVAGLRGRYTALGFGLWGGPDAAMAEAIAPLLAGDGMPELVDLRLVCCGPVTLEALVASPLFPRLRQLDLRRSTLRGELHRLHDAHHLRMLAIDEPSWRELTKLREALPQTLISTDPWRWP